MPDEKDLDLIATETEAAGEEKVEKTPAQPNPADPTANEEDGVEEEPKPRKIEWNRDTVSKVVEKRLLRDRQAREREFSQLAGVDMTLDTVKNAVRMWGFLQQNPDINEQLGAAAAKRLGGQQGYTLATPDNSREKALEMKEAMLTLKEKDKTFRENEQEILEWAELNDYEVNDARSLRIAYLAWKGENLPTAVATAEANAQKRALEAQQSKADAKLIPGRGTRTGKPIDYKNATAEEILKAEGLSLLVDEPE